MYKFISNQTKCFERIDSKRIIVKEKKRLLINLIDLFL